MRQALFAVDENHIADFVRLLEDGMHTAVELALDLTVTEEELYRDCRRWCQEQRVAFPNAFTP